MLYRFLNVDWYFSMDRYNLSFLLTDNNMFRSVNRNAFFKSFGFIDDILNDNWNLDVSCW